MHLFLAVPVVGLWSVIAAFPGNTHYNYFQNIIHPVPDIGAVINSMGST